MSRPGLPQPTLGQAPVVPATGLPCVRHSREPNIGQNALFPGLLKNRVRLGCLGGCMRDLVLWNVAAGWAGWLPGLGRRVGLAGQAAWGAGG